MKTNAQPWPLICWPKGDAAGDGRFDITAIRPKTPAKAKIGAKPLTANACSGPISKRREKTIRVLKEAMRGKELDILLRYLSYKTNKMEPLS